MSSNDVFISEVNEGRRTLQHRAAELTELLKPEFESASSIIETFRAAAPDAAPVSSPCVQLYVPFVNVMCGMSIDVKQGLAKTRLDIIPDSIARIERVEQAYAGDLAAFHLTQKPSDVVRSIQAKLQTYVAGLEEGPTAF